MAIFYTDTGSFFQLEVTSSLRATGSLFGTSSYGVSASYAVSVDNADIAVAAGGSTNNSVSQLVFSNANGISFGLNNNTITATIAAGGGGVAASYFANVPVTFGTNTTTAGGSSILVQPFILPYGISAGYFRFLYTNSFSSTTIQTTANSTYNVSEGQTWFLNLYSQGTGASSKSLQQIANTSATIKWEATGSIGAASNNQTIYNTLYYPGEGGAASTFTATYNVSSANINFSTTGLTAFTGYRFLDIPFATSLAAGNYWMAVQRSTATASTGGNGANAYSFNNSIIMMTNINQSPSPFGNTRTGTQITYGELLGLGIWSTNTNGATTNSIALSLVSTAASQPLIPFQIIRQA